MCPVTEVNMEYNPRKIIRQIHLGMKEEVLSSPLIWLCMMCYRCYSRCPQQVNFTDIMGALRYLAVKQGYASGEAMKRNDEIERLSQVFRQEMIKRPDEDKNQLIKTLSKKLQSEFDEVERD